MELRQRSKVRDVDRATAVVSPLVKSRRDSNILSSHELATVLQVIVLCVAIHFNYQLPTPLTIEAAPQQFSEARARVHLEALVSYGVRTVGSRANELLAPRYIGNTVEKIRSVAPPGVEIEMEVQHPTGSFYIDFLDGFTNTYSNITNVLVRISHSEEAKKHALLVSAHFDSALGSPAATDDVVNIAGMLELLRVLSVGDPLKNAVIFNFNGAEETIMQASHGFITQHAWVPTIKAFVNMEESSAYLLPCFLPDDILSQYI